MFKCLLLGDINKRRVQRSDIHDKWSSKTVASANMDHLICWVNEQLKVTPSECEIYCGLYNILEGKPPENILDSLGYLVSDLEQKSMCDRSCQYNYPWKFNVQVTITNRFLSEGKQMG